MLALDTAAGAIETARAMVAAFLEEPASPQVPAQPPEAADPDAPCPHETTRPLPTMGGGAPMALCLQCGEPVPA